MKDWKTVKLGSLLTESKIVSEKPNADKRISVRLNIQGVEKRPLAKEKKGATKYFIRKAGQFIYGKQNLHKGAFGIVPQELDGFESSSDIPAFDIDKSCYPEWVFYFFKKGAFYLKLESLAKGVGSKRIHPKQIFELDIFLPSKEEQRKVLDEIEKAEIKNQELIKEIESQEENIKREKEKLVEEKIIKKEKPLPQINKDEIPFEIPEKWKWCRFQDLYNYIEAGKSPKCHPYPANKDQWGVIKISAISWGAFNGNENKMLPLNQVPFIDKEIKTGDFILTRANTRELIARSVIVGENVRDKLLLNDKTLRISISKFVNKEFLNFSNISPYAREYYFNMASGTSESMKNISRLEISSILIPLPPINEQIEIVRKINQLQANCNNLEKEIISSKANSEMLIQSVLSNCYRKTNLWKMSKYPDDIDAFYAELKLQIEQMKTIKESDKKGYLELV